MAHIPFLLGLDSHPFYNHDVFPNRMYRQQHPRHHDPLDLSTLGLIANLGAHAHHRRNDELAPISTKKDLFEARIDVAHFQPEEISVKVINNSIVVEGKHEEREDDHHGYITRHFIRRYELPKDYDPEKIVSTLSADGILTVRVPKPIRADESGEFVVPIQITGASELFLHNGQKTSEQGSKTAKEEKEQEKLD